VVLERGKAVAARSHEEAADLPEGVGGAGLFSDGKFSYFPSGTQLYQLGDRRMLRIAYDWCVDRLTVAGISTEPFPPDTSTTAQTSKMKRYPSHYASLERRLALIERLAAAAPSVRTESPVTTLASDDDGGYVLETDTRGSVEASAIVLTTGRFGPLGLAAAANGARFPLTPLRYELGIRIESPRTQGFAGELSIPDVKRIWNVDGIEVRTFCTCRRGEIWGLPAAGLFPLSGRADGRPTEFSNFGLLARFAADAFESGARVWAALESALRRRRATYEPLEAFLGGIGAWPSAGERPWFPRDAFEPGSIRAIVGDRFHASLTTAVLDLLDWSPSLRHPATVCLFPAIEGIGLYPLVDASLRVPRHRVWCAGDVVGRFRGLVPALVSGYYAGACAAAASG
jgi:hypothetical protein